MTTKNNLAIIIPAYKATFLAAALDSIAAQTCKDFTLYIGDDCSPHNLGAIVDKYRDDVNIVYRRFDTNLGGKDLVEQWERCINLNQGEEWIWLFSDDDIMEPQCVEMFYKTVEEKPQARLLHFNINIINSNNDVIHSIENWPDYISTKAYMDTKIPGKGCINFVVEFIFHKDIYTKAHGFENYDLAWGSDTITWFKFSHYAQGIYTINGAFVNWRESDENISPNRSNDIIFRKMRSVIHSTKWITDYAKENNWGRFWFYGKHAIGDIRRNRDVLTRHQLKELAKEYISINQFSALEKLFVKLFIVYL